jgi:hypothetical protein
MGIVSSRKKTKLIHEGQYAAEVEVDMIDDDTGWAPYLSVEDASKLDAIREALRSGRIEQACQLGRVFQLQPLPHQEHA